MEYKDLKHEFKRIEEEAKNMKLEYHEPDFGVNGTLADEYERVFKEENPDIKTLERLMYILAAEMHVIKEMGPNSHCTGNMDMYLGLVILKARQLDRLAGKDVLFSVRDFQLHFAIYKDPIVVSQNDDVRIVSRRIDENTIDFCVTDLETGISYQKRMAITEFCKLDYPKLVTAFEMPDKFKLDSEWMLSRNNKEIEK